MSFEDIEDHMVRYQELLEEQEAFRQQKKELRESEMALIASKPPYRSKFYSLAVREATTRDPTTELRTSLLMKQDTYASQIKERYAPKIDEKKQQELQELIKKMKHPRKKDIGSRRYVEEGKRNLEKLHLLMAELRAKNRLKPNEPIPNETTIQAPKRYKNYL